MLRMINNLALNTAVLFLGILEYLMLFRAIMSWFPQMQGGKLFAFVYGITEPIIMPFRRLLQNINALRGFPIDISFMLAFMMLIFLEMLLQGMII